MRYALLLAALVAAPAVADAAAPSTSICFVDRSRGRRVVEPQTMTCVDHYEAKFDILNNFRFSCGVRNTFNLFGALCDRPCHSAVRGVRAYAAHNKTVAYGPALLPTSADNKWAFALYDGSCYQLREKVQRGEKVSLENLVDDDLIKAAELPPPGKN